MDVGRLNLSGERGLKKCGFGIRIHWFRVDGGPIREKKLCSLTNILIRVNMALPYSHA